MERADRLRIGIIVPPMLPLPPQGYAGTERVVTALSVELHRRGHDVTVFASGDSELPCRVVPVVPKALWPAGYRGDVSSYISLAVARAWQESDRFDVIHSHVEGGGFVMARHCPVPTLSTLHGRLDGHGMPELIEMFPDIPLVAISESQRRWSPGANWLATIHHGLDFADVPFSVDPGRYLLVVGRAAPQKGITEAIELARTTGLPLVLALKVHDRDEEDLYETAIRPAIENGTVDWRGEVNGTERNRLYAGALATLMLGAWPEPFGLVAIESMATGTPVIARRAGACTETVEHGLTGFLVDDLQEAALAVSRVAGLERARIRAYARGRFSVQRMTDAYEGTYRSLVEERPPSRIAPVGPSAGAISTGASRRPERAPVASDNGASVSALRRQGKIAR
ncbi:MAG: glycosyltransferase family 4 protein [Candidatus Limnocylindria bacterium]